MSLTLNKEKIRMIISDFDGIFTDKTDIIDIHGQFSKRINFHDERAIAHAIRMGLDFDVITAGKFGVVDYLDGKFEELQSFQEVKNKFQVVKQLAKENHIDLENILDIGDDVNDIESMLAVTKKADMTGELCK